MIWLQFDNQSCFDNLYICATHNLFLGQYVWELH